MNSNLTLILVAVIAAFPPTLVAFLGLRHSKKNNMAIQEVHVMMNSRMDELLSASKAESRAEGREAGREEEKSKI